MIDKNKLQELMEKTKEKDQKWLNEETNKRSIGEFFKPDVSGLSVQQTRVYKLRILPVDPVNGSIRFFKTGFHYNVPVESNNAESDSYDGGVKYAAFKCLRVHNGNYSSYCPICAMCDELYKNGDEAQAKRIKQSIKTWVLALDKTNPDDLKIVIWALTLTQYKAIQEKFQAFARDGKKVLGKIFKEPYSISEGCDIELKVTKLDNTKGARIPYKAEISEYSMPEPFIDGLSEEQSLEFITTYIEAVGEERFRFVDILGPIDSAQDIKRKMGLIADSSDSAVEEANTSFNNSIGANKKSNAPIPAEEESEYDDFINSAGKEYSQPSEAGEYCISEEEDESDTKELSVEQPHEVVKSVQQKPSKAAESVSKQKSAMNDRLAQLKENLKNKKSKE